MARRRWRTRTAAAIALSLALHGVLVATLLSALARRAPAPPARKGSPALPVELRSGGAPPPPTSPAPRRLPRRAGDGASTEGAAASAGAETLERWLSEGRVPPRGGDLLATPRPRGLGPPAARPTTPDERLGARLGDVLDGLRAEDLARYPDASWTGLRDALGAGFLPPGEAIELARGSGAGGGGPGFLGRFLDAWGAAAARYGRTGSSLPSTPDAPGARVDSPQASARAVVAAGESGDRAGLASALEALDAQVGPSAPLEASGGLVAVVAVVLDGEGRVASVRLVARSASAAYDRAALEQAERLAGRELSPRLASTVTEWAFVTEVRLRPLSPAAAVQLDATFKPTGFAHPLERVVRTRVELRAVRRVLP